jgi:hypothetical protein
MPPAPGTLVEDGDLYPDVRQHLFHGAHVAGKLIGAVELLLYPDQNRLSPGDELSLAAVVMNAKAGHMIPSGSAEERVVWLHVEAEDSRGQRYHLPVTPKGFPGEEYTIASADALAYQDMGDIMGLADFPGVKRDGDVPAGDRIFRLPYLNPAGQMTIAQWYTASFGPDYRLPPLQAVTESYSWSLPPDIASGEVKITATVYYSLLVSSVAEFLGVPATESAAVAMNSATATLLID